MIVGTIPTLPRAGRKTAAFGLPAAALVAIVAWLAGAALPSPAQAAFPGINGQIVFSSFQDNNGNVFATQPMTGAPLARLTTDPADEAMPTWSPDGRRIAF